MACLVFWQRYNDEPSLLRYCAMMTFAPCHIVKSYFK